VNLSSVEPTKAGDDDFMAAVTDDNATAPLSSGDSIVMPTNNDASVSVQTVMPCGLGSVLVAAGYCVTLSVLLDRSTLMSWLCVLVDESMR
jgi:hypothetical protein